MKKHLYTFLFLLSLLTSLAAGLITCYCSLAHLYIDPNIGLLLYTGLQVRHLEAPIYDVHEEVREPGRLLSRRLHQQLVEQGVRLLSEGVPSEELERKEGLGAEQALGEVQEAAVAYRVVGQVDVDQGAV